MWNPGRNWSTASLITAVSWTHNDICEIMLMSFSFQSQTFHVMVAPILPLFVQLHSHHCTFHSVWVFSVVPCVPWFNEEWVGCLGSLYRLLITEGCILEQWQSLNISISLQRSPPVLDKDSCFHFWMTVVRHICEYYALTETECCFSRPSHDLKPGAKQRIHGVVVVECCSEAVSITLLQ